MKKLFCTIIALIMLFAIPIPALAASASAPVTVMNTGSENVAPGVLSYTNTDLLAPGRAGVKTAVTVPRKGILCVVAGLTEATAASKVNVDLSRTEAMTDPVAGTSSLNDGLFTCCFGVEAGTYWLAAYTDDTATSYKVDLHVVLLSVSDANRKMNAGGRITVGVTSVDQKNLFKLKAEKTGVLTLTGDYAGYVRLLDSKKKAVSDNIILATSSKYKEPYRTASFGVKKGQTYYIQTTNAVSPYNMFSLKYNIKSVTDKSGAARSKALSMKSGKKYTGLAVAGTKTTDWYRLTVKKKKVLSLYLSGALSDGVKIEFYNSKGGKFSGSGTVRRTSSSALFHPYNVKSGKKITPGTYYIKVTSGAKDSGSYTLMWK